MFNKLDSEGILYKLNRTNQSFLLLKENKSPKKDAIAIFFFTAIIGRTLYYCYLYSFQMKSKRIMFCKSNTFATL